MLLKSMGVINITPNSFSDGNLYNNPEGFKAQFQAVSAWADIIDIGAESTAPFNDAISEEEELKRFEQAFFPFLESESDPEKTISIDTYKINVFKKVATKIHEKWPKSDIVFNDVSGKLDDELMELLDKFEIPFTYIFSHNLCTDRNSVLKHMDNTIKSEGIEFVKEVVEYFLHGVDKISKTGRKFYIDPCFGFSKTREQNHTLIQRMNTFFLQMPYSVSCVYGISRKSFLRFPADMDAKDPDNQIELDQMQAGLIYDVIKDNFKREFIFRMHTPGPLKAAQNIKNILKG